MGFKMNRLHKRQVSKKKDMGKEKKIAKAAARLFGKQGYVQTSMDQIAIASRMSKGGMYYYFQNKIEVLFYILTYSMDLLLNNINDDLEKLDKAEERLYFIIRRHIDIFTKNIAESKTLIHETNSLPQKYRRVILKKERQYFNLVKDVISENFEGKIEKVQLKILTFLLFGQCNLIYSWYDPKGKVGPEELADLICRNFLGAVRARLP